MTRIRTAVKALIVCDGRLLSNHCRNAGGDHCALPGDEPRMGHVPDAQQLGIAWLAAREMKDRTIKPSWLVDVVGAGRSDGLAIHQGDRD